MRLGRIQNNYTAEGFDIALRGQNEFIEICCNSDEGTVHAGSRQFIM